MKAYIVEIYKNYCIVMTADGQFIRQNIPAGFHEIGDEISWEESGVLNAGKSNLMRMIGRVAIGFAAVAVITTGAYFGIKFANVNSTAGTVSLAQATSQEKKITEVPESDANGAVAESSQQEASDVSVEILKAQPSEEMSQASMLYEANYNIDKFNTDMLVEYPDLQIIYRVSREQLAAKSSNDQLTFNFTGVKDDSSFNGNVDAILNDENLIATRTFTVVFEDFTFGQKKYESLVLEDIEKSFKLIIYGYFE